MNVSMEELRQLVEALQQSSPREQEILRKLGAYDEAIGKAIALRTRLEFNAELEQLEQSNFARCHSLIEDNRKLQSRVIELEGLLMEASQDRELLRFEKQKVKNLESQLEQVKQLAAFNQEVCTVIDDIEEAITQQTTENSNAAHFQAGSEEAEFIAVEKQRLQLLRLALEERHSSYNTLESITQDIVESNNRRMKLQLETIESLNEQLKCKTQLQSKLDSLLPSDQPVSAEKRLIRNYEAELKKLLKQGDHYKKAIEDLEFKAVGLKNAADTTIYEREQLRLQNTALKQKIDILLQNRASFINTEVDRNLSEKEEVVLQLKESIIAADSTIAHLRTEAALHLEQLAQLKNTHAREAAKQTADQSRQIKVLKEQIQQLKQSHEEAIVRLQRQRLRQSSKESNQPNRETMKQAVSKDIAVHSKDKSEELKKKVDTLTTEMRELKLSNQQLNHDRMEAIHKADQAVSTIRGLELEMNRLSGLLSSQKLRGERAATADSGVPPISMRDLDDIINLLTFVR